MQEIEAQSSATFGNQQHGDNNEELPETRPSLSDGQRANKKLLDLLGDGKLVEATSKRVDISKPPDYFDEQRFKRAQAACQRHFSSLSFASTSGLLLLVQIKGIMVPLLKTGKSRTVPDLYDRYTATAKYIRKFYETDFYDQTSEAWTYLNLVRGMHLRIHSIMNESRNENKINKDSNFVWVNQYDMALTQFAFIGLFLLRPEMCAAYYATRQDLEDITYYWRLISYYFGIEDRFNIFEFSEDLDEQLKLMQLLLDHMNLELSEPRDVVGTKMAEGIMLAFEDLSKELSFNILDHWWQPLASISGLAQPAPYSLADRWKLLNFMFAFNILMRIKPLVGFLNQMYKKKFDKFCARADKIKPKLGEKYSHLIYEISNDTVS